MPMGGRIIKECIDEIKQDITNEVLKKWRENPSLKLKAVLEMCGYSTIVAEDMTIDEFDEAAFMENKSLEELAAVLI